MPKEARFLNELQYAVQDNRLDEVKYLIKSRTKSSKKDKGSLFCGMWDGDEKLAKDFDATVLEAVRLKDSTILSYLVKYGVSVNFMHDVTSSKHTKISPLHVAVEARLHDNIALLLNANANVNQKDHDGRTPLFLATKIADCETVRMLLFRGANPHILDATGTSPLQIASRFGHVELVRVLMEHDAKIFEPSQKGPSPLHIAAMEGHVPLIDIYSHFVDVNIALTCDVSKTEKTVLHVAAERGLIETCRFLVEQYGADVNVLDSEANSALHYLVRNKHNYKRMRRREDFESLAEYFLQKQARINQQNTKGNSPLHLAAKNGFHKIVEILLTHNADTMVTNNDEKVPSDVVPMDDLIMKQIFSKFAQYRSNVLYPTVPVGSCPCSPTMLCRRFTGFNIMQNATPEEETRRAPQCTTMYHSASHERASAPPAMPPVV